MEEEWVDQKYQCDNCEYDGPGKFYYINMCGWKPMCICDDCIDRLAVWNEE